MANPKQIMMILTEAGNRMEENVFKNDVKAFFGPTAWDEFTSQYNRKFARERLEDAVNAYSVMLDYGMTDEEKNRMLRYVAVLWKCEREKLDFDKAYDELKIGDLYEKYRVDM